VSVVDPSPAGSGVPQPGRRLTARARTLRRFVANRTVIPAVVVLLAVVAAGLLAPWLAPYDPLDQDLRNTFAHPSSDHWLGTDNFGRDILSRLIFGARIAVIAVGEAVGIALLIGLPVGLAIGYVGGWWDRITMRVVEAIVSIPGIMLAIVIVTILGIGLTNAMVALGILYSTQFIRLCRGLVIAEREEEYVRAARVLGASRTRITVRHLVPNIAGPIIVQATLACGAVLLAEAGLSFLGLAVQPPDASWGTMLTTASQFIALEPWQAIPPGFAIFLAVLAINLLGDAMRDSMGRGTNPVVAASPAASASRFRRGGAADPLPSPANPPLEPHAGEDAVLTIAGLEIQFPDARGSWHPVVTDMALTIDRGQSLGLVGESGSGKSVSALAALGMVPSPGAVTAGTIRLDGHDIVGAPPARLRAIRGDSVAMVFQDPMASLNPGLRVGRQLAEVLRVKRGLGRREARVRTIELLDMVGIPDPASRADRFPHEFSGGMVQRIAIARALSCDPSLLIADEPTTALDVTVQSEILELLGRLQDELGMAILFISHDLSVVAEIADRAAVMYAGQVVEEAPIDELLTAPRHPYTEALLRSVPHAANRGERLPTIPGSVPKPGRWAAGCRFAPRCPYADAACSEPQSLAIADAPATPSVRCHRAHELALAGVSATPATSPGEASDAGG